MAYRFRGTLASGVKFSGKQEAQNLGAACGIALKKIADETDSGEIKSFIITVTNGKDSFRLVAPTAAAAPARKRSKK